MAGLTLTEATDFVKKVYRDKKITLEDAERVQVALISARVHRIVVLREDTPSPVVQLVQPDRSIISIAVLRTWLTCLPMKMTCCMPLP